MAIAEATGGFAAGIINSIVREVGFQQRELQVVVVTHICK
jgi:hypothetical protein